MAVLASYLLVNNSDLIARLHEGKLLLVLLTSLALVWFNRVFHE